MEVRSKTADSGSPEKRMDLGSNVDTRLRESLRAPGYSERSDTHSEAGLSHQGKPDYGKETACRGGGVELEALLGADPPVHREAWHWIKGWYKAAVDHNTRPARVTLERIKAERGNCTVMYHHW